MLDRTCARCHSPVTRKSGKGAWPKYCSDECRRPTKRCRTCNKALGLTLGNKYIGQAKYCSDDCKPRCEAPGCEHPQRGRWCAKHADRGRKGHDFDGPNWTSEWECVVCGTEVQRNSGRRKHCSAACQVADSRHKGARPKNATCQLCRRQFSLLRRMSDGRIQRTDTKWCRQCGRDSPDVKRFIRYGITPEVYDDAMKRGCSICGRTDRKLHVDHDHNCCHARKFRLCGKCNRGLICGSCNRALGMLGDDPNVIRNAARYLEEGARI